MGVDGANGSKTDGGASLAARFPRLEQTFPALTPQEIARMRRFGEVRSYKDRERLFETGKPGPGMFVILSGHVAISQRDGLGHVTPVINEGPGQFLAEIGQLSGRAALVDGQAEGDVETLLIPPRSASATNSARNRSGGIKSVSRSEEHTSELQSLRHLVCR